MNPPYSAPVGNQGPYMPPYNQAPHTNSYSAFLMHGGTESRVMKTTELDRSYRENYEQELAETVRYLHLQDKYESDMKLFKEEIISLLENMELSDSRVMKTTEIAELDRSYRENYEQKPAETRSSEIRMIKEIISLCENKLSEFQSQFTHKLCSSQGKEEIIYLKTKFDHMSSKMSERESLIREKYSKLEPCREHATEIFDGTLGCPNLGDSRENGSLGRQGSSSDRIAETFSRSSLFDASTESMQSPLSNRKDITTEKNTLKSQPLINSQSSGDRERKNDCVSEVYDENYSNSLESQRSKRHDDDSLRYQGAKCSCKPRRMTKFKPLIRRSTSSPLYRFHLTDKIKEENPDIDFDTVSLPMDKHKKLLECLLAATYEELLAEKEALYLKAEREAGMFDF